MPKEKYKFSPDLFLPLQNTQEMFTKSVTACVVRAVISSMVSNNTLPHLLFETLHLWFSCWKNLKQVLKEGGECAEIHDVNFFFFFNRKEPLKSKYDDLSEGMALKQLY